jgi:hypothetical protein
MPNVITGAIQTLIEEELETLDWEDRPMLDRLKAKNFKVTSQKKIKWNANVGGASVSGSLVTSDVTTDNNKTSIVPAELPIATSRYQHRFTLIKTDVAEAKEAGKGALRDLFAIDIQEGMSEILDKVNNSIYLGDGTADHGGIIGLIQARDAATYANIATATYANWAGLVKKNAGTNRALSTDLLEQMDIDIRRNKGKYSALYMPPEMAKRYRKLFTDSTAFSASVNVEVGGKVDLGFTQLTWKGKPIIEDINAPNNEIQFLDEQKIHLFSFRHDKTETKEGLQFAVDELPSMNPAANIYVITIMPQLRVRNRKAISTLGDITQ